MARFVNVGVSCQIWLKVKEMDDLQLFAVVCLAVNGQGHWKINFDVRPQLLLKV